MKRHYLLIAIGLGLIASPFLAAHPADSLQMKMDSTGTILSVIVFHPVKNPANHFIVTIEVKVNGIQNVLQTYRGQYDKAVQEAVYKLISLKPLDKVEVTAVCSIAGKAKAVYNVPEP
jgi:hypothetical protein